MGIIWALNLVFIVDPANRFFGTFADTAASFAPTTATGPGLAQTTAAHAAVFAWLIALVTLYLALAFLLGFTTRAACLVGSAFSVTLLVTQWGSTFSIPGGTDVGPHPLYLLLYAGLLFGGAGRRWALDTHRWSSRTSRLAMTEVPL